MKKEEKGIDFETLRKVLMGGNIKGGEEGEFITECGIISVYPSNIYFYADVLPDSVLKLNNILIQMMKENLAESATKNKQPDPIHIHINSPGGLCSSGFIAYDTIMAVKEKVPVYTHVEGHAASAATMISVVGTKRFITPSSDMLIHEMSTWIGGSKSQIMEQYQNVLKIQNRIEELYLRHSKFTLEELKEILKRDTLLSAEESLEKGLVDEISTVIF